MNKVGDAKCLKALLEEIDIEVGKTHSLLTLKAAAERDYSIDWDEDTLSLLNKLYIDSRYPTESGLLPNGAPSLEDARDLARFAAEAMDEADALLTR